MLAARAASRAADSRVPACLPLLFHRLLKSGIELGLLPTTGRRLRSSPASIAAATSCSPGKALPASPS
jgi:hypothetical protein